MPYYIKGPLGSENITLAVRYKNMLIQIDIFCLQTKFH